MSGIDDTRKVANDSLGIVLHNLGRVSDEHADGHRVPQHATGASLSTSTELLNHLGDGHPVLFSNEIQQTQSVILHDVAGTRNLTLTRGTTAATAAPKVARGQTEHTTRRDSLGIYGLLGFVGPTLDGVAGDGMQMVGRNQSSR